MTQEQKAEAYDNAIEKIKYVMEQDISPVLNKEDLQDIFPELREFEDEIIRKYFIMVFKRMLEEDNLQPLGTVETSKLLAWLKKQGDKDKLIKELGEYKVKYTQEILSQQLEKQCKQKATNKVEPKFKVGTWIISKYMHLVMQILNNDIGCYKTVETDGTERYDSYDFIDRNFKLWTIQDAKNSDVLLSKHNQPFIYNGIFDEEYVGAYCGICCLGIDLLEATLPCNWSCKEGVKPANKEQRDTLFTKMNEAGYEFDFKDKELRKIEKQVPKWSEEDEDNLNLAIYHIRCDDIPYSPHDVEPIVDWLNSIKQRLGGDDYERK